MMTQFLYTPSLLLADTDNRLANTPSQGYEQCPEGHLRTDRAQYWIVLNCYWSMDTSVYTQSDGGGVSVGEWDIQWYSFIVVNQLTDNNDDDDDDGENYYKQLFGV